MTKKEGLKMKEILSVGLQFLIGLLIGVTIITVIAPPCLQYIERAKQEAKIQEVVDKEIEEYLDEILGGYEE